MAWVRTARVLDGKSPLASRLRTKLGLGCLPRKPARSELMRSCNRSNGNSSARFSAAKAHPGRPQRFASTVGEIRRLPSGAQSRGPSPNSLRFAASKQRRRVSLRTRCARGHEPSAPQRLRGALRPARTRLCRNAGGFRREHKSASITDRGPEFFSQHAPQCRDGQRLALRLGLPGAHRCLARRRIDKANAVLSLIGSDLARVKFKGHVALRILNAYDQVQRVE
jgi:hypothetical protein